MLAKIHKNNQTNTATLVDDGDDWTPVTLLRGFVLDGVVGGGCFGFCMVAMEAQVK